MSFKEKRILTTIVTGMVILAMYIYYGYSQYQSNQNIMLDMQFWAETMLIFIGIGIIATIVIQILFHILYSIGIYISENIKVEMNLQEKVSEKDVERKITAEFVEDERDKLIELKSLRIGFIFAGIGFLAGLLAIYLGQPVGVMLNITFISMLLGSIMEGLAQLYYYRRG